MAFEVISPSGKTIPGYSRRDALYAAGVLAEREKRFSTRQSDPISVYEDGKKIADVWADLQEDSQ